MDRFVIGRCAVIILRERTGHPNHDGRKMHGGLALGFSFQVFFFFFFFFF